MAIFPYNFRFFLFDFWGHCDTDLHRLFRLFGLLFGFRQQHLGLLWRRCLFWLYRRYPQALTFVDFNRIICLLLFFNVYTFYQNFVLDRYPLHTSHLLKFRRFISFLNNFLLHFNRLTCCMRIILRPGCGFVRIVRVLQHFEVFNYCLKFFQVAWFCVRFEGIGGLNNINSLIRIIQSLIILLQRKLDWAYVFILGKKVLVDVFKLATIFIMWILKVHFFGALFYIDRLEKALQSFLVLLGGLIIDAHAVIGTHYASKTRSTLMHFSE